MVFIHPRSKRGFKHSIFGSSGLLSKRVSSSPWTPSEITTTAWYDATETSTIIESSGSVSQWNDKSGSGNPVIQMSAGRQPTTGVETINGLNALYFVGDDLEDASFTIPSSGNLSAFIVYDYTGESSAGAGLLGFVGGNFWRLENDGTGNWDPRINVSGIGGTNETFADVPYNDPAIFAVKCDFDSSVRNGWVNGTKKTSDQTYSSKLTSTQFRICNDNGNNKMHGRVGEVVVCEDVTTATQQLIEGYLAWKWCLVGSLPVSHPYKSSRPTV